MWRRLSIVKGKLTLRSLDMDKCDSTSHLPDVPADAMDMDHIYLSFFDFLWACTFVFPSAHILVLKGTITLVTRAYAAKLGIYRAVHQNN